MEVYKRWVPSSLFGSIIHLSTIIQSSTSIFLTVNLLIHLQSWLDLMAYCLQLRIKFVYLIRASFSKWFSLFFSILKISIIGFQIALRFLLVATRMVYPQPQGIHVRSTWTIRAAEYSTLLRVSMTCQWSGFFFPTLPAMRVGTSNTYCMQCCYFYFFFVDVTSSAAEKQSPKAMERYLGCEATLEK